MRLTSDDGASVELRPLRYQFGASGQPGDWDANWLVMRGDVRLADGRSWSFTDPCLTTWEARSLGSWLGGVRQGVVGTTGPAGEGDEPSLVFTEPKLAFSLAGREAGAVVVRVHLSSSAVPPTPPGAERPDLYEFVVEVRLAPAALARVEDAWSRELAAFPVR